MGKRKSKLPKKHYRQAGLIGATVRNAKKAEEEYHRLIRKRRDLKYLEHGTIRKDLTPKEHRQALNNEKRLREVAKISTRTEYLPQIRDLQQKIHNVKQKGPEAEAYLPQLERRLETQLEFLRAGKKTKSTKTAKSKPSVRLLRLRKESEELGDEIHRLQDDLHREMHRRHLDHLIEK